MKIKKPRIIGKEARQCGLLVNKFLNRNPPKNMFNRTQFLDK